MKKPIHSSNLALRFYMSDGWTKEELDLLCTKGEVLNNHPKDKDPYFVLNHEKGSCFDAVKLYEKCSILVRTYNDYPHETDIQFIERYNW